MDFKKFVNMNVNLKDFTDVYNSYATSKNNFGGGYVKVKDLIKQNGGKLKATKTSKKKGGAVADSDALNNIYYSTRPSGEFTNINTFTDLSVNQQSAPAASSTQRSIF